MDNEIELDIVTQEWAGAMPGLKPWIVIEAESGEIIEHTDPVAEFLLAREKYGDVLAQRPEPPPMVERGEALTRLTKVIPIVPMPK